MNKVIFMKFNKELLKKWIDRWNSEENSYNKVISDINSFCEEFLTALENNDSLTVFEKSSLIARDLDQDKFSPSSIVEAWDVFSGSLIKLFKEEDSSPEIVERVEIFFDKAKIGFLEELLKRERIELEGVQERERELSTRFEVADYELSIALSKRVDLCEAMNLTLDTVIRLIGAERASIMLWNTKGEYLTVKAARGVDATPFGLSKIKSGHGIAGWVFKHGKTRVVNDVRKDEHFVKSPSNQEEIKSIICLPLIAEDCKIGVLNVGTLSRYHVFTAEEIKTLELIASRSALVIDNVILQQNIKEKTDQLNAIVKYMGDGVLTFDEKGVITLSNRAAEAIIDINEEDILGKEWTSVIKLRDDKGKEVEIEPSFTLKKSKGFFTTKNHERKFLIAIATPLLNSDGIKTGGIVVFGDMSREKEIEKMKSEFVSIVSHDLRSPLTSVKGYASMLLNYSSRLDEEKKKEFLEIIINEIDRLVRLIKGLLDLGRIESGKFEIQNIEFAMGPLIKNVAATYRSSEEHSIKIVEPENVPPLIGDPDQLEQVLHNLVGNAIKYSPDGGEVEVGIKVDDGKLTVYVQDQGIGIPPEEIDGVFDKFQRVNSGQKIVGAGLGLFITKNIIEAHNGKIWAESEEGKGSRFCFSLNI